jgi:MarR family transcriptional regulator, 2-MHQ and catechol-resistance regulon repressor
MANRGLQHELKKKRPFDSLEQEATLNILRTSDLFGNRLGRLFRRFGLTSSQYNVLRILRGEGQPLPALEIAARMIQVVPAITGLVDRLEEQGLVERRRSSEDRRVVFVAVTAKALAILKRLDEPLAALHRSLLGHLSRPELRQLSRVLEKARRPRATQAGDAPSRAAANR